MGSFVKILEEDNWLSSIEDLRSLPQDFWEKNKFPLKLVQEILNEISPQEKQADVQVAPQPKSAKGPIQIGGDNTQSRLAESKKAT